MTRKGYDWATFAAGVAIGLVFGLLWWTRGDLASLRRDVDHLSKEVEQMRGYVLLGELLDEEAI